MQSNHSKRGVELRPACQPWEASPIWMFARRFVARVLVRYN